MAQFLASIKPASRREVTRLGHKSGITVRLNGWGSGVEVHAWTDDHGQDHFEVRRTGGSNGNGSTTEVAAWMS